MTGRETTVVIDAPSGAHPDMLEVEVVERKGRGHPDTICDALAEAFSIGLTRAYHDACGAVLHHNVDKVLLAAGSSAPRFGGGEVLAPIQIFLAGRATAAIDGAAIPVAGIAEQAGQTWFGANLPALDVARHVRIHTVVHPGSAALTALLARGQTTGFVANDTSFAIGHAPPSRLERVVLAVEETLTSNDTRGAHPMIGPDVKVMGLRRGHQIDLTVACAIVDRHVSGPSDYADAKTEVTRLAEHAALEADTRHVRVAVNAGDDIEAGRVYLTVTGTSAEAGDDGQAGRGNRVGGLITPCRAMTLEAAAGKNVVSHVGKSYGIIAHQIARALVTERQEIADATCLLLSRIGWPVETPQIMELRIRTRDGLPLDRLRPAVEEIARTRLRGVAELPQALLTRGSLESPAAWPGVLLF